MPSDARQKMIESAVTLLALHGLEGTAFSDVLERSGAPRGSIYHHFPEGKDQMIEAAIDLAGERALGVLDRLHGAPPKAVTQAFFDLWRAVLVRSNLRAGCAVLAVTVATDSPDLLDQAASIFRAWRGRIADLFVEGGMAADAAARLAATLVAASEGAVVVSRAERSLETFESVAAQLLAVTPDAGAPRDSGSSAPEPPDQERGGRQT